MLSAQLNEVSAPGTLCFRQTVGNSWRKAEQCTDITLEFLGGPLFKGICRFSDMDDYIRHSVRLECWSVEEWCELKLIWPYDSASSRISRQLCFACQPSAFFKADETYGD